MLHIGKHLPLLGIWLLIGCSFGSSSSPVEYPPLSFKRYQPIYMAVSSIEIVEEYKSPERPPYVEHLMPYSPTEALRIWVRDRLRTTGNSKTMQAIIHDASVLATDTSPPSKTTGWLPNSLKPFRPNRRYDAKLEVEMRIYNQGVLSEASIFVTATRSITLPGSASENDMNLAFRNMIGDMMEYFNAEMEKNMFMYMSNYINYSQSP